jgi:hypothetical protein
VSGIHVRPPDLAPAARSALGGVVAVALVSGGILALQKLVPAERDPAVVGDPNDTFTLGPALVSPPASATKPAPPTSAAPSPVSTTPPPASATPTSSPTAAVRPAITVLNNSRVTGLAKKAAADFARGGWRIAGTGNLSGRLARTTVYYGPGQQEAAVALRKQYPAIADLAPRYAGLPGDGGLTVVVTRDYPH